MQIAVAGTYATLGR